MENSNHNDIQHLESRVLLIEKLVRKLELETVRQEHVIETLEKEISTNDVDFKAYQTRIRNNWSKFLWIIGGATLSGIVSWILKGGLNNVAQ